MIIDLIITIFFSIINTILNSLPTVTDLDVNVVNAFSAISHYYGRINLIIPLTTIFYVISLGIAFETGLLGFKALVFIYKRIKS